ncbi:unnamed protein product [Spirodela intermedia]|uniref:BURP domain-containing protein n=1 Tax=Spirodela intermedia TaxID=51605 RepID=A0A7I8J7W0_SPIIN|nr:unnamed protein product [Spirodela intermedia]CAA6665503.1 unnamed protein product [Spirodela intermedia]
MLKTGTAMAMPDLRDRMPRRAFLPRSIAQKLPFSTARLEDMNRAFNATPDTALAKAMASTVAECERAPSRGETKRCATSVEDMIDFATAVLGSDVVVRSTESAAGSRRSFVVGKVTGVDGGRVTRAVSCHQSLFPFQVYYCHSVPKVRVYEAEILAGAAEKINHGVAICRIEVCHWIFPGDMTWTVSD